MAQWGQSEGFSSGVGWSLEVEQLSDDAGDGGWNPLAQFVRHARKVGLSVGSEGTLTHIKQEMCKLT